MRPRGWRPRHGSWPSRCRRAWPLWGARMTMHCPMCHGKTRFCGAEQINLLQKVRVYQCRDPYCSCSFETLSTVVRTLRPSKIPRPGVNIPISTRAAKRRENKEKREAAEAAARLAQSQGTDAVAGAPVPAGGAPHGSTLASAAPAAATPPGRKRRATPHGDALQALAALWPTRAAPAE